MIIIYHFDKQSFSYSYYLTLPLINQTFNNLYSINERLKDITAMDSFKT